MEETVNLNNALAATVGKITPLLKACAKANVKLSKAAFVPELAKALDPEQTGILNHLKRIKLLTKLIGKPKNSTPLLGLNPVKLSKTKSTAQDIELVGYALELLAIQNAQLTLLLKLLAATALPQASELISQCIQENKETHIWITRTLDGLIQQIPTDTSKGSS